MNPKSLKVIVVGDSQVGKSNLISRFKNEPFSPVYKGTIGIDFSIANIELNSDDICKLQIWDTSGQEKFEVLYPSYIKISHIALICFDVTNQESFDNVEKWYKKVCSKERKIVLIANKCDRKERVITPEMVSQFAYNHHIDFFETSAKEAENLPTILQEITMSYVDVDVPQLTIPANMKNIAPSQFFAPINETVDIIYLIGNMFCDLYSRFIPFEKLEGPRGYMLEEFGKIMQVLRLNKDSDDVNLKNLLNHPQTAWMFKDKARLKNNEYNRIIAEIKATCDETIKSQLKAFNVWLDNEVIPKVNQPNSNLANLDRHQEVLEAFDNPTAVKKTLFDRIGWWMVGGERSEQTEQTVAFKKP